MGVMWDSGTWVGILWGLFGLCWPTMVLLLLMLLPPGSRARAGSCHYASFVVGDGSLKCGGVVG